MLRPCNENPQVGDIGFAYIHAMSDGIPRVTQWYSGDHIRPKKTVPWIQGIVRIKSLKGQY